MSRFFVCGPWLQWTDLVFICNTCIQGRGVLYVRARVLRKHLLFGWHQTNVIAFNGLWSKCIKLNAVFSSLCYFLSSSVTLLCAPYNTALFIFAPRMCKILSVSVFSLVFHFLGLPQFSLSHTNTIASNYRSPQTNILALVLLFLSLNFNFVPFPSASPFVYSIIFLLVCLFILPFICLLYLKSFHLLRRGLICLWLMISFLLHSS